MGGALERHEQPTAGASEIQNRLAQREAQAGGRGAKEVPGVGELFFDAEDAPHASCSVGSHATILEDGLRQQGRGALTDDAKVSDFRL